MVLLQKSIWQVQDIYYIYLYTFCTLPQWEKDHFNFVCVCYKSNSVFIKKKEQEEKVVLLIWTLTNDTERIYEDFCI